MDDLPEPIETVEGAHLTEQTAPVRIDRYRAPDGLEDLVRRFWIPIWGLPDGQVQTQRVLQYPTCLAIVTEDYARFQGVETGRSSVQLEGSGWGFGVMFQPAAGRLLWQAPVDQLTDRHVDLADVPGLDGARLADDVRTVMTAEPTDPQRQAAAISHLADRLRAHLPVDEVALQVNEVVDLVESDRELTRVDDLAERVAMDGRTLQRLTSTWLGLTPKWLIQRRRLHDAVRALKLGDTTLASLAHDLGYTDQAHFTRDFTKATGTPPGRWRANQP